MEVRISDGETLLRAVYLNFLAKRSVRVNGQANPILRAGESVDIEWFPATDRLKTADISVRNEKPGSQPPWPTATTSGNGNGVVEGNHIRFTLAALPAGDYTLFVSGKVEVDVEACEGASQCEAQIYVSGKELQVPFTVR